MREWLYVDNAIQGIWRTTISPRRHQRYCLGGGTILSNMQVIENIYKLLQMEIPEVRLVMRLKHTDDRPTDDWRYALDSRLARQALEWDDGSTKFMANLRKTIGWYVRAIIADGGGASHGREAEL